MTDMAAVEAENHSGGLTMLLSKVHAAIAKEF